MTANQKKSGSFLYGLDPRTKLLLVFVFTFLVFIVDSLPVAAAQMLFFTVLCLSAGIPLKIIFPHRRFLIFLLIFIIVLQVLFGRESPESRYLIYPLIPDWVPLLGGKGSLKLNGLFTGLMISCRIAALTVLLPVLTMTTEARHLACGLTRLGFPYRTAHIITSTLNLIPSFEEEIRCIMDARKLRGVKTFEEGRFIAKLKEYPLLVLPLMIKAMRKAQLVSLSMDARAFGAYKTRTWLPEIRMSVRDYSVLSAGIIYAVMAVALNFFLQK
ncbi:MAG: energy-coupling factor transporter transmembrane protein EcfT [Treponema sp.]|nr:energy-coupling factor transporter transmembrane protein EcfT [Treponema sp.]